MVDNVGRPRGQFTFDYEDLERVTGLPRDTCMQHRVRGQFDPEQLETVLLYIMRHAKEGLREQLALSLIRRSSESKVGHVLPGKLGVNRKSVPKKKKKA
jgi:hypothetical protein